MARKKNYITNIYKRDIDALNILRVAGHADKELLLNHISNSRIQNYLKQGIIVNVATMNQKGYKIAPKGIDLIKKVMPGEGIYQAQSLKHDLEIAKKFCSLSENEQKSWQVESELRDRFLNRLNTLHDEDLEKYKELSDHYANGKISMPDGSYTTIDIETSQEIEVVFEVTTNSYGRQEIAAKEIAKTIINPKSKIEFKKA